MFFPDFWDKTMKRRSASWGPLDSDEGLFLEATLIPRAS